MAGFRDKLKKRKKKFKRKHSPGGKPVRTGGRFPSIFNKEKIPEGVGFFSCKEGEHIVDILPWECGPDMPLDDQNSPITEEGDFDYVLDIFVHTNVGSMQQPYVCPYENFGEPCPICEYIKANRLPKDEWSKTRAKRRSIYLIWDRKDEETEKKGVQIFDAAHFFMEEKIEEIAKLPRGGGYIMFSDPDDGKHVSWTRKGSGATDTRYIGHKFIDRERPIPDSILEKTFSLDKVINMHPSYEEIEKAFYGNKKDAECQTDEEEETSKKKRKRPTDRKKSKVVGKKKVVKKKKKKKPVDDDDIPY